MNRTFKPILMAIGLCIALAASVFAAPGDLDPTFGNGGIAVSGSQGLYFVTAMALQADGKIVVVGQGPWGGSTVGWGIARYNTNGSLDTSFGGSGVVVTPPYDTAESVAIQADGKIVVAGGSFVVRYNLNGSLDPTFNGTGKVIMPGDAKSVAIQADGKIVVAGSSNGSSFGRFTLFRYKTDGSLDTSFDNDGIATIDFAVAYAVAIQADGKIVAGGYTPQGPVVRYNSNGSLDTTFNGPASGSCSSVAIQADGKILTAAGGDVARYGADGTPDTSFGGTGSVAVGISVYSVVVQPDGKIVAAGGAEFGGFAVVRLNANGSLDTTFGGTGRVITPIDTQNYYGGFAYAVAIQPDGKIVAAGGAFEPIFDTFDRALVRYQGDPVAPNPIDSPDFFISQQYRDFLGREPEPAGLNDWQRVLANCPAGDLECFHQARLTVSAAFFGSPEFRLKGYFAFRFYRAAFNRLPLYSEIIADMQSLNGQTPADVYANRSAFANSFVQRTEFINKFNSLSNAGYVNTLLSLYGLSVVTTPDPTLPDQTNKLPLTQPLLTELLDAGILTRAQVLRAIVDSDEVFQMDFNRAFVAMQYYGYLRRTPEEAGYNAWLNYLNTHPTDFREMVRGFMDSTEYRRRFGTP